MMRRLLLLCLALSACSSATSGTRSLSLTHPRCTTDRQCNQANVCTRCDKSRGRCVSISNCCNEKNRCKRGKCLMAIGRLFGFCDNRGPTSQLCPRGKPCPRYPLCTVDAHCRHKAQFCLAGVCRSCAADKQCQSLGHVCASCNKRAGHCFLRRNCCQSAIDCRGKNILCKKKPGERAGFCEPGCLNDAVCPTDHYCDLGVCRKRNKN